jgi:hypothetical protein
MFGLFGKSKAKKTVKQGGDSGVTIVGLPKDFNPDHIINSVLFTRVEPLAFGKLYIEDEDGEQSDVLTKSYIEGDFIEIYSKMVAQTMVKGYAVALVEDYGARSFSMPDGIEVNLVDNRVYSAKYDGKEYSIDDLIVIYDMWYIIFKKSRYNSCISDAKILGAILSARYSTAKYRGALGILTRKAQEITGGEMQDFEKEKDEIQEKYKQQYGVQLDQSQIIITTQDLSWQSMAQPVSTLGLKESKREAIEGVCMIFGVTADLVIAGSTFSNVQQARLSVMTDIIIPTANRDMGEFRKKLKLKGYIKLDFSEHPLIKKASAESDKEHLKILQQAFKDGIISQDEYRKNISEYVELQDDYIPKTPIDDGNH